MTVNIYADEMILINFMANILIIEMTKRLLRERVSLLKESIAGFVVSVIYTLFVISDLRVYINMFTILILNRLELII